MSPLVIDAASEADTEALGARLAGLLPAAFVVGLDGPLGAGKTRLVKAIGAALGIDHEAISSPTFVLIHEYQGRVKLFHFDAYRIRDDDEFLELGPEEYFEGQGATLVEWASRVARCLPPDCAVSSDGDISCPEDSGAGNGSTDAGAGDPGSSEGSEGQVDPVEPNAGAPR